MLRKSGAFRPQYWWPLEDSMDSTTGALVGTFTHAGTNRTQVNPTSGLIEAVGANVGRFENVGGHNALLVEPAGINLCTYSEIFRAALGDWSNTSCTIGDNATTAPDGTETADKIVEASDVATYHQIAHTIAGASFTDDTSVTYSVYLKPAERPWARLVVSTKAANFYGAYFNLATGAVGTETVDSYGSESMGNGWYRYWITHDIENGAGTPVFFVILAEAANDQTYDGDGSSGIYIWGAQVEESPVPTSYIPTVASAVTRATESGEPHWTLPTGLFDAEGTAIIWWRPGYAEAVATADGGILSCRDDGSSLIYADISGNGVASHDGTTEAAQALAYAANT